MSFILLSCAIPRIPIWRTPLHRTPYMTFYGNSEAASCFSAVFRRLLYKNLSTSPASRLSASFDVVAMEERKDKKPTKEVEALTSPNIVARLMGLESMPEFDWMSRLPDTVNSSRDLIGSDPVREKSQRKLNTTGSFRESTPTYLLQENDEFLLMSFECHSFKERKRDKERRRKNKENFNQKNMKSGEDIVARRKRVDAGEEDDGIEPEVQQESSQSPSSYINANNWKREMDVLSERRSESDSSSENFSPVSVLDRPFEAEIEFLAPAKKGWRFNQEVAALRKVGGMILTSSSSCCTEVMRREKIKVEDRISAYHRRLWRDSSIQFEDGLLLNLNWVSFRDWWRAGESEEIGIEIELQILDYLLHDLAYELLNIFVDQ